jgi:ADP-ribose pyrophosphatase
MRGIMPKKVQITSKKQLLSGFFNVEEVKLRHSLFNGNMSEEITRLCLNRGDSVVGVLHFKDKNNVLLIEQFRYPTYEKGPGWMLELPAGVVGKGETPQVALAREIEEEVGYRIFPAALTHISTFYASPGGSSERISVFYAPLTERDRVSVGGGLAAEGEDIRQLFLSVPEAFAKIGKGEIIDAKTIIGLQWLERHLRQPSP